MRLTIFFYFFFSVCATRYTYTLNPIILILEESGHQEQDLSLWSMKMIELINYMMSFVGHPFADGPTRKVHRIRGPYTRI